MTLVGALAEVLLVNLVLSGDNAVVVGLAARDLPPRARRRVVLIGGGLAALLRVALTWPAAALLGVPLVRAGGGLLLAAIAYRLLVDETEEGDHAAQGNVAAAVRLIVLADLTMSLDNVLAVAAVAERSAHPLLVLGIGLAVAVPLVVAGGALVARLMSRVPWLVWVGAAVLTVTAAELVADDAAVARLGVPSAAWPFAAGVLTAGVLGAAWHRRRNGARRSPGQGEATRSAPSARSAFGGTVVRPSRERRRFGGGVARAHLGRVAGRLTPAASREDLVRPRTRLLTGSFLTVALGLSFFVLGEVNHNEEISDVGALLATVGGLVVLVATGLGW